MDDRQRARMATIQKAMTKIAMRMLDSSDWDQAMNLDTELQSSLDQAANPDADFQARMIAIVPSLVVVVQGLWDMHIHQLPHTQVPPAVTTAERARFAQPLDTVPGLISAVQMVWEMHLGELPHPPVDRGQPAP